MSTPLWVHEHASRFWSGRAAPPPPRNLAPLVAGTLPLIVQNRPHLMLSDVLATLSRMGLPYPTTEPNRPLRACLYCRAGHGIVFLDPADPPEEQRFSLAHEIAHFLLDYDAPRRRAEHRSGPETLQVLDGLRHATSHERLAGVLRDSPTQPHVHLMARNTVGEPATPAERDAELRADRLAYELLAPAEWFTIESSAESIRDRLVLECDLPAAAAADYARLLRPPPLRVPLLDVLRKIT